MPKTLSENSVTDSPACFAPGQTLVERVQDEAWDWVINGFLIEWGKNASLLAEDGLVAPSPEIIKEACRIATELREKGVPGPTSVIPNGDGGIVFERRVGRSLQLIEIHDDKSVYVASFKDSELVGRHRILF